MKRREKRQVRRSALNEVAFRRYFPASWFSSLGSWMLRFLLGWSAWDLTASASWVGITAALMLAPALLLSPWFGILSDRINPRYGLVASMLVHGIIALGGADHFSVTATGLLIMALCAALSSFLAPNSR